MFKKSTAVWLFPISFLSEMVAAQTSAPVYPVPPSPPAAQASFLTYRSAFQGYKPYTDDKILDWKAVNDTTGRIGGWRAYASEAQQPDDTVPALDTSQMPDTKTGAGKP